MPIELDDLLAECIEAAEEGRLDLPEVIGRHPEHAAQLRRYFDNVDWMGRQGDPVRTDPPASDLSGRRLGDFELREVLGRGGMGVVYRARQLSLGRDVALKVIATGVLAGQQQRRRFRREAIAAGALDHPGIVPVIDSGHQEGLDYFAMRLVEGPTLCELMGDGSTTMPPRRAATILRDVARAVEAAHRAGVIHRDIKPDNIMIDTGDHDGVDRPVVLDFGLARLSDDPSVTRSGQILGTPHYMSPQQAAGATAIDHRTDIYSLGAVLYAILTGGPPHGNDSPQGNDPPLAEVLRRVMQDSPPPLSTVNRRVPSPLAKICHAAMQTNVDARYHTAAEMADDLHRFLCGEPVVASEAGVVQRVFDELDRDAHGGHFAAWSTVLWQIGLIVFVAHGLIWWFARNDDPVWWGYWVPRVLMLTAIAARIGLARDGSFWPRAAAERPVWSIWLGYITSLGCINLFALAGAIDAALLLPIAAVLSSFGFIAMAGTVWGGSGLIGLGFLVVAGMTLWSPSSAPLWLGGGWLAALLVLSSHYRRVARDQSQSINQPINQPIRATTASPVQPTRAAS